MKNIFLEKFVHEKGRRFYPAPLPVDIERGKIGDCFDHCLLQAVKSKGRYRYCEGMVHIKGKWIHHAWLTDRDGLVAYDPTWKAVAADGEILPMSMAHYLGAVLDLENVIEFVVRTEYKSPFANYEKAPELAQKVYDSAR